MNIKLEELLPEEISDETAYHISEFIMALALAVNSYYFANKRRHCKDCRQNKEDYSADPF